MAKDNKTVKLYTADVVAATSSKGNQEKWYDADSNNWYKLDKIGFESLAEAVDSELLVKHSNIESELGYTVVRYHIETVNVHRKDRIASVSPNFLNSEQSIQTVYHILKRVLGSDYQRVLADEKNISNRLALIVDTVEKVSGLTEFGKYITLLFEVDALIANEDRHLNNIAVIEENGAYDYCPLFDNGEGFMLDNVRYPFDVRTQGLMRNLRAKPFNCQFGRCVNTARGLYGAQLKVSFTDEDVLDIIDRHLYQYQKFIQPYLKQRIVDVVSLQRNKYF